MAESVGELAVRVGADVTPLKKGLEKGSSAVSKFAKDSTDKLRSVTTNMVAMGTAATAAGAAIVTALYTKQSDVIDQLAKTSDALGTTIVGLQALNRLAELNGVSAEAMAKGLQRMEVRLGEAARKGGAASQALENLGIQLADIVSQSPEQQIEMVANALGDIDNQALKASIATDLFGREGLKMLKVLTQLDKEGLEPTIKDLEKFGLAISRVDAAKVEAANDAFLKAEEILGGVATKLTIELAPFVQEAAERFAQLADSGVNFGEVVTDSLESVVNGVAFVADAVHGLQVVFKGVELIAKGFGSAALTTFEMVMESILSMTNGAIDQVNNVISALNEIPGVDIANIDIFGNSEFMNGLRQAAEESRMELATVREELHNLAMEELPSEGVRAFFEEVKKGANESAEATARAVEEQRKLSTGSDGQLIEAQAKTNKSLVDMNRTKWGTIAGDTAKAAGSMLNTIGQYNKQAFKISKAFAIVETIISTAQGIAEGVKLGWPAGIPAVAWAAATGLAQLATIKSQQYNGGSSGGGGSISRPSSSVGSTAAPASQPANAGGTLTVSPIDPNAIFSGSQLASFGERIYDYTKDGGEVVFQA